MKKGLLLSFFILGTLSCITNESLTKRNKNREILKELFFYKCIFYGYPESQFSELDISASVYIDISCYSPEAYLKVDSLAKDFVSKIDYKDTYYESANAKGVFIQAFDFFKSDSLDHFINSLDKYMCK